MNPSTVYINAVARRYDKQDALWPGYPRKNGRATSVDDATSVISREIEVNVTKRLLDTVCSYCSVGGVLLRLDQDVWADQDDFKT